MVSGFQKSGEWADAKSCADSGVEPELVLRLRAGSTALCVVEATAEDHVRFRARAWKCKDQVAERAHHPQIVRADSGNFFVREIVIDPIEAKPDGELRYADRQAEDRIVSGDLGVAQLSDGNDGATTNPKGKHFLAKRRPDEGKCE